MSSEIMSLEHPLSMTMGRSTPLPPDSLLCTPQWTVAVSTSPLVHSYLSCSVYIRALLSRVFFSFRFSVCCDSHLCFFGCICCCFSLPFLLFLLLLLFLYLFFLVFFVASGSWVSPSLTALADSPTSFGSGFSLHLDFL